MKKIVKPITELRDTNNISKQCHDVEEPITITKNGYDDLVIMSSETFNKIKNNGEEIIQSEGYPYSPCLSMIKVGCTTNDIVLCDTNHNVNDICKRIEENKDLDILVFPELCVTGYSCGDLFYLNDLLSGALKGIEQIKQFSVISNTLVFIGAPLLFHNKLYNCAIAICHGEVLGVIPKSNIPGYNEFYETRQFKEYHDENATILLNGEKVPFGTKLIFINRYQTSLRVACELCEDLWAVNTPSTSHAMAGANVIVNLSASNELYGKDVTRRNLVQSSSSRLICAYLYASAGNGESTTDLVFSGHKIISENGVILKESELFTNETIKTEIDLDIINTARRKMSSYDEHNDESYQYIYYSKKLEVLDELTRFINPYPFLPTNENESVIYANKILKLQYMGLVKRMQHINSKNVVLGLSGGLDSTLALIVCYEAFKYLGLDTKGIHTITMPCFGTSSRTHDNAIKLCDILHTSFKEIPINKSVTQHLNDIDHDLKTTDIAFENAQARERTQVLFDYSNMVNGFVIGTGDLSELALGWCTYNGDHMSNYSVNASVPKTLVRFLVKAYANEHDELKEVLYDILDTPVSPELLPTKNGKIAQITESVIGPYELHDFFLYNLLKYNYSFEKIYYLAKIAFKDIYKEEDIKKYLNLFTKRFFNSQFKRSTLPDGPKVTEISLSPRGDLRMPSDASYKDFNI